MPTVRLADIAFARAGDKGDTANVALFAPDEETYRVLVGQITPERVAALLDGFVTGPVTVHPVPGVLALNVVMGGALGGGGPSSLRADNLGKALGGALLRLPVDVPDALAARARERPWPPRDPYADADWVVRGVARGW